MLKANCEEIKEKEQDEDYHKQTPIDKELEMMVDNLLISFPTVIQTLIFCEKLSRLISVIAYKTVNKNIYEDGEETSSVYKDSEKLKELDLKVISKERIDVL